MLFSQFPRCRRLDDYLAFHDNVKELSGIIVIEHYAMFFELEVSHVTVQMIYSPLLYVPFLFTEELVVFEIFL